MNEVSPSAVALPQISRGSSVSASSTASEMGRISRAANSRQTRWISRCSSVSSSMDRRLLNAIGDEMLQAALGDLVGDDHPLNLRGALPDAVHPGVAVDPLDRVLPHVAAAAEDLQRTVDDAARRLRRGELDH